MSRSWRLWSAANAFYLLHAWMGRVEFPELKRKLIAFTAEWKPAAVIVEDKASGQSLVQELKRDTTLPIIAVKVDVDKLARAQAVTPLFEAGKVLLPEAAPWAEDLIEELAGFPAAAHDDLVDSVTQALAYMRSGQDLAFRLEDLQRAFAGTVKPLQVLEGS